MYDIVLTKKAQKFYENCDEKIARKLNRCFDHLRENPYEHPNIKSLRGRLAGSLRYRVGDYRVVYEIKEEHKQVIILLIVHRSKAYQ